MLRPPAAGENKTRGDKMAEQKFEDALNKLEKIVSDLEDGELKLDDAIKKYEEGVKLSRVCNKKLNEITKKIKVLVEDDSGDLAEEEFDAPTLAADEGADKDKPARRKSLPKGEKYLF